MQELINNIVTNANISESQAEIALQTVKEYVKEKFPMMAGAVDKLFEKQKEEEDYL